MAVIGDSRRHMECRLCEGSCTYSPHNYSEKSDAQSTIFPNEIPGSHGLVQRHVELPGDSHTSLDQIWWGKICPWWYHSICVYNKKSGHSSHCIHVQKKNSMFSQEKGLNLVQSN